MGFVDADLSSLPDDLDALEAVLIAPRAEVATEHARAVVAAAELTQGRDATERLQVPLNLS
jgi:hypothetical protein